MKKVLSRITLLVLLLLSVVLCVSNDQTVKGDSAILPTNLAFRTFTSSWIDPQASSWSGVDNVQTTYFLSFSTVDYTFDSLTGVWVVNSFDSSTSSICLAERIATDDGYNLRYPVPCYITYAFFYDGGSFNDISLYYFIYGDTNAYFFGSFTNSINSLSPGERYSQTIYYSSSTSVHDFSAFTLYFSGADNLSFRFQIELGDEFILFVVPEYYSTFSDDDTSGVFDVNNTAFFTLIDTAKTVWGWLFETHDLPVAINIGSVHVSSFNIFYLIVGGGFLAFVVLGLIKKFVPGL